MHNSSSQRLLSAYHMHCVIYSLQQFYKIGGIIIPQKQMRKLKTRDVVELILEHTVVTQ